MNNYYFTVGVIVLTLLLILWHGYFKKIFHQNEVHRIKKEEWIKRF